MNVDCCISHCAAGTIYFILLSLFRVSVSSSRSDWNSYVRWWAILTPMWNSGLSKRNERQERVSSTCPFDESQLCCSKLFLMILEVSFLIHTIILICSRMIFELKGTDWELWIGLPSLCSGCLAADQNQICRWIFMHFKLISLK